MRLNRLNFVRCERKSCSRGKWTRQSLGSPFTVGALAVRLPMYGKLVMWIPPGVSRGLFPQVLRIPSGGETDRVKLHWGPGS